MTWNPLADRLARTTLPRNRRVSRPEEIREAFGANSEGIPVWWSNSIFVMRAKTSGNRFVPPDTMTPCLRSRPTTRPSTAPPRSGSVSAPTMRMMLPCGVTTSIFIATLELVGLCLKQLFHAAEAFGANSANLIFTANGADAVSTFVMRSKTSWNVFLFVPFDNTTLTYFFFLRMSTSHTKLLKNEVTWSPPGGRSAGQHFRVAEACDADGNYVLWEFPVVT